MNINWNDLSQISILVKKYCLRLLRISSVNSDFIGIQKVFQELESICSELNFCWDYTADNMVMRITNKPINFHVSCRLAMVCHIDTVDYNISQWNSNPLGEIKNDRIYGRGIIDDKGALVLALLSAKANENFYNEPWIIIVGSSEEGIWTDMEKYHLEKHPIPDYATTIDGDGIQFGCRGYADIKFVFSPMFNCNNIKIENIHIPGSATNIVPGFAIATLSDGTVLSETGRPCHSSIPQNGSNALIKLAKKLEIDFKKQFPNFFELMNDIKSCALPQFKIIDTLPLVHGISVLGSSVCPTTCEIQNGNLILNLNFRLSVGTEENKFRELLYILSNKYNCKTQITKLTLPNFMDPNSSMIKSQLNAYEEVLGKATTATIAPGMGYNSAFKAKYGCNIFGPRFAVCDDEEDLCHCNNESRSIDDLLKFYKMLCIFMKDFLK